MRHLFVLNCSDFKKQMHSKMYSCLFRAANIKEENIIDSQANVVTSLQVKERKTHLLFVSDLKIDRRMRLCVIIKKHKAYWIIGWLACNKWTELQDKNLQLQK